jgi:dTDP-4-dehydrorhamnose reductase
MTHTKVITIGGSGLVGSRVRELLGEKFTFKDLSRKDGVDITDRSSLHMLEKDSEYSCVLLLAAKADVDGCEKDKEVGENGEAWRINVQGTRNVAEACRESGKKLIYVSTDFVFNGENTPEEGYSEEDKPDPINWYAKTKYEGEKAVQDSGVKYIIARTAYPYRKEFDAKLDFVRAIAGRLQSHQEVAAIADHIMTPTFIDDIALGIQKLIEEDAEGIFHVTGSESLSPFEAAIEIAKSLKVDLHLVKKTTRAMFFKDRAPRPFNLSMKNAKISKLGASMRTFTQGLEEVFQK